jgi:hypothetical protein
MQIIGRLVIVHIFLSMSFLAIYIKMIFLSVYIVFPVELISIVLML